MNYVPYVKVEFDIIIHEKWTECRILHVIDHFAVVHGSMAVKWITYLDNWIVNFIHCSTLHIFVSRFVEPLLFNSNDFLLRFAKHLTSDERRRREYSLWYMRKFLLIPSCSLLQENPLHLKRHSLFPRLIHKSFSKVQFIVISQVIGYLTHFHKVWVTAFLIKIYVGISISVVLLLVPFRCC